MTEEEALATMQHTIAVYAQRLHGRFQGYLVSWTVEDLQQEGRCAVVQACRTFDPTRAAFPTYARRRIWWAMGEYVRHAMPGTRHTRVDLVSIEDLPGGIDWMPETRRTCTCTAAYQPCPACQTWGEQAPRSRRRPRADGPPAELRLRGLTDAYQPGSTQPLDVPLGPLEVGWL
jgi:hypothetical protein